LSQAQAVAPQGQPQSAPLDSTRTIIDALKPRSRAYLPARNIVVKEEPVEVPPSASNAAASHPAPTGWPQRADDPIRPPALALTTALPAVPPEVENTAGAGSYAMEIQFDYGSARIRTESLASLGRLAEALRAPELAGDHFVVEGHTDASGDPAENLRLSQRRADEVRRFLLGHGVQAQRLMAQGLGDRQPANPNNPRAPENRRVRIVNLE
jgi:outer membrane protein OmpA-like peptidoglycan-associated protein